MSDNVNVAVPSPSRSELKQFATWRAWFYREAAARDRIMHGDAVGAAPADFDRWYRLELERAPAIDDEAEMQILWALLDTAATAGGRLRAIRKHYRLTQIDMAAIADVEQGTVSRWEADETDITDAHLTIYSYLCQGAALAFLRYGAQAPTRPPAPRLVGRVIAAQAVTPITGSPPRVELGDLQFTRARAGATTDLMALEIDDVPELYLLRPGWLVIYEGASDTPRKADQEVAGDVLRGRPAALDRCLQQLCVVGLSDHPDNGIYAGQVLLREVRAAVKPGFYELAAFRPDTVDYGKIAWASPVIALLPPRLRTSIVSTQPDIVTPLS